MEAMPNAEILVRAYVLAGIYGDSEAEPPVYVVGSGVPIPGGAQEKEKTASITYPDRACATIQSFHKHFLCLGLSEAWERLPEW